MYQIRELRMSLRPLQEGYMGTMRRSQERSYVPLLSMTHVGLCVSHPSDSGLFKVGQFKSQRGGGLALEDRAKGPLNYKLCFSPEDFGLFRSSLQQGGKIK